MAFPRSGRSPTWRLEVRDSGKPPESVLAATFPISARQAFLGPGLAKRQGARCEFGLEDGTGITHYAAPAWDEANE